MSESIMTSQLAQQKELCDEDDDDLRAFQLGELYLGAKKQAPKWDNLGSWQKHIWKKTALQLESF